MYQIFSFFQQVIQFAVDIMQNPFYIYGVEFTLWEVFMFVLLGGLFWAFILYIFD